MTLLKQISFFCLILCFPSLVLANKEFDKNEVNCLYKTSSHDLWFFSDALTYQLHIANKTSIESIHSALKLDPSSLPDGIKFDLKQIIIDELISREPKDHLKVYIRFSPVNSYLTPKEYSATRKLRSMSE